MVIFPLGKGDEKMDKISAALICGTVGLVLISTIIVYNTWIVEKAPEHPAQETLIFNDDTSVTNNSAGNLWLRVKVDKTEGEEEAEVISRYIDSDCWIDGQDGWYYYHESIGFARSTKPFAEEIRYAQANAKGNGCFRLNVEAVDQAWLFTVPTDGKEAFELFKRENEAPGMIAL